MKNGCQEPTRQRAPLRFLRPASASKDLVLRSIVFITKSLHVVCQRRADDFCTVNRTACMVSSEQSLLLKIWQLIPAACGHKRSQKGKVLS
jgi:hypothetical protein